MEVSLPILVGITIVAMFFGYFFGLFEGLPEEKLVLLAIVGYTHDLIVIPEAIDNEEKTVVFVLKNLSSGEFGFSKKDLAEIKEMILATKMPQNPKNLIEQICCDADLGSLGSANFFTISEKLREEWKKPKDINWLKTQQDFLKSQRYFTKAARLLRDEGKAKNLEILEKMIRGEIEYK